MEKLIKSIISIANKLDDTGHHNLADELDKIAASYPDWGATEGRAQELELFNRYRSGQLTKEQYADELKKLQDKKKLETDPYLEQKTQQVKK
jgi:hypothetical protein